MKETSWEYGGRSVEEATQIALEELGLERDDVYVEILEEPQKGFLGLGGKEARIRVELIGEWEVLQKAEEPGKRPPEATREETIAEQAKGNVAPPAMDMTYEEPEEDQEETYEPSSDKPVEMVNEILKMIGVEATVEAREREDSLVVDVWGDDVAILIGKGGQTLDALQYMVNISCRRTGEGYRKRRKAKLEKQAEQTARDAVSRGRSLEMPPMSASERKIVHMTLRKLGGVWTESSGEDPDRRVVIHPQDSSST
jgi:spoIIIJ-associated protein